ncbi:MAG: glutamate 5-kinase [Gammaproteobacteria bacterium]
MQINRQQLGSAPRWVVKIGSALLTNEGRGLDLDTIGGWAEQLASLHAAGKQFLLVSSGAIAEGMSRLGWQQRPHALYELQAAAAVGQMGLVQAYESHFQLHGIRCAQVLLTHEDLADRRRYLNARSTLRALLSLGVIPVVNENDTVTDDDIRLGDNDTLAALVANLIEANLMVILTDQEGLHESDPRTNSNAKVILEASVDDVLLDKAAGPSASHLGLGGMITKISAARRAARSGAATLIVNGRQEQVFEQIAAGATLGTLLLPGREPLLARKQWIANQLNVSGTLHLDTGAARVLRESGRSLLAVGVTNTDGEFSRGEMVRCIDPHGMEIARGLVNYAAAETRIIKGKPSGEIEALLGYVDEPELIHRDNLVLV